MGNTFETVRTQRGKGIALLKSIYENIVKANSKANKALDVIDNLSKWDGESVFYASIGGDVHFVILKVDMK